jgi:hypothetical protein
MNSANVVIAALLAGAWVLSATGAETPPAARPNVIFILSDDQGAWALRHACAAELVTLRRIGAAELAGWKSTTKQVFPPYSTERLPWYPLR